MTGFIPISVIESTTKRSCHLYSLWRLCLCTSMTIETWGKLLTKCICHCELWLPGSYGCPMIGEAEVSSYNAMSACKCTFEFSGVGVQFDAYDMVWTAGNAEWACQKGTVRDFPFGSWSLPMVWKLCRGLWLWCNMRTSCIGYLWVLSLYNDGIKCEWNCFDLLTSNQNSFWCEPVAWDEFNDAADTVIISQDYDPGCPLTEDKAINLKPWWHLYQTICIQVGRSMFQSLAILGLGLGASETIIKVHYRQLACKYHPDKNDTAIISLTTSEASTFFRLLNNSHQYLKDRA